jgi:hypothetical protein
MPALSFPRFSPSASHISKSFLVRCCSAILLAGSLLKPAWAQPADPGAESLAPRASRAGLPTQDNWNQSMLPIAFEENRGQADSSIRFLSHTSNGTLAFMANQVLLPCDAGAQKALMTIESAGPVQVKAEEETGGVANYYPDERSRWIESVPLMRQLRYSDATEGVDLVFHGNSGRLEYDLEVAAGADPGAVRLAPGPNVKFWIEPDGSAVLSGASGCGADRLSFLAPTAYQTIHGNRSTVHAEFIVSATGNLGFSVGTYDHTLPLTIDPVVAYTRIIGMNLATTVAGLRIDSAGDVFLTGQTNASNYPVAGSGVGSGGGSQQVYVTKLDPTGSQILYSTYIPAKAFSTASSVAVDPNGNAYIAGVTSDGSFPTTSQNLGVCNPTFCNAGFIAKFNATGAMVYSTMTGTGQQLPKSIAVDSAGNAYLAGYTADSGLQTVNAFQTGYTAGVCTSCSGPFFAKLNPTGTAWVFASYFSGPSASFLQTGASVVQIDPHGNIYLAGSGDGVPLKNSLQSGIGGSFVAEFAPDGKTLLFSTLLGGYVTGTADTGPGMQVASDGTIFLAGIVDNYDFPYTPVALMHALYPSSGPINMYAAAIDPAHTKYIFSTMLGTGTVTSTALDPSGNFYVGGTFGAGSIPSKNALDSDLSVGAYILELDRTGALVNSTAFGGRNYEQVPSGLAVDGVGDIFLAGALGISTSNIIADPISIGSDYGNQAALGASYNGYSTFVAKIAPANQPQLSLGYVLPILTLRNAGSADLHISNIQTGGGFANAHSTCGPTVAAGTSCFLTPSDSSGNFANGTITINSDAQFASSQTFTPSPLTLNGPAVSIGARPWIDSSQLVFPPTQNGNTAGPRPIRVWNLGTAPATISNIVTFTGVSQTNDCNTIAPQAFCTVQVSITPAANGNGINGDIGIVFSNSVRSDVFPQFTPNPIAGPLLLSASTALNYGNVLVGQTSIPRIVTVTNTGNSAVLVADPTLSGTGSSAFSISSNSCSGVSLQPQQSCVIAAVFQPTAPGRLPVPMVVSGGGYSNTVYVVGTGVAAPTVSITPATANLGSITAGSTATQIFQVTNNTTASVTINNLTATLASAAPSNEYSEQDTCQGVTLAAGASCSVTVSLTPKPGAGSRDGVLSLGLNGGTVWQTATLSANVPFVPTALTLTANPTSSSYGQQVLLTATLSPYISAGQNTSGESITFSTGSGSLGTATLSGGTATLAASSLPGGSNSLTASYPGDANFSASTSSAVGVTVTPITVGTSTAISASSTNAVTGTSITFTASVSPSSGATAPSGTARFYDGSALLGSGMLNATGVATYTTSALSIATHSITATYTGVTTASIVFTGSVSPALPVAVTAQPPDFNVSLGATSTTVTHGSAATTTIAVTPVAGFSAATTISCTGAPVNSTCTASPNPITPIGAGPITSTITLQTSVTTAAISALGAYSMASLPLGVFTGLWLLLLSRKRSPAILALILAVGAGLVSTIGCAKGTATSTPSNATAAPGTYTLTIKATSGAAVHSVPWTVDIQ